MGSKKSRRRSFSKDFILGVLRDYYSTDSSKNFICRKYDIETQVQDRTAIFGVRYRP